MPESYDRPCAGFKPGISIECHPGNPEEDGVRTILPVWGTVSLAACAMGSAGTGGMATRARQPRVGLVVQARGLSPGEHGVHVHAVGRCDPPGFTTAGDHFNPLARKHGLEASEGPHAGDLPNLRADPGGSARYEATTDRITLSGGASTAFDADGSALVIHARPDDQRTDPSGNSGDRVICGVARAEGLSRRPRRAGVRRGESA